MLSQAAACWAAGPAAAAAAAAAGPSGSSRPSPSAAGAACFGRRATQQPAARRQSGPAPGATRPGGAMVVMATQNGGGVGGFLKRAVGLIPVVGLVSRIVSPDGGIGEDQPSYGDYCRGVRETVSDDFGRACSQLEKLCPRGADDRFVNYVLWASATAVLWIPVDDIIAGAARLPVTRDLNAEIDRVIVGRDAAMKKYPSRRGGRAAPADVRAAMTAGLRKLVCLDRPAGDEAVEALIGRIVAAVTAPLPQS